jgi:hypothetical protein
VARRGDVGVLALSVKREPQHVAFGKQWESWSFMARRMSTCLHRLSGATFGLRRRRLARSDRLRAIRLGLLRRRGRGKQPAAYLIGGVGGAMGVRLTLAGRARQNEGTHAASARGAWDPAPRRARPTHQTNQRASPSFTLPQAWTRRGRCGTSGAASRAHEGSKKVCATNRSSRSPGSASISKISTSPRSWTRRDLAQPGRTARPRSQPFPDTATRGLPRRRNVHRPDRPR